jgi:hypothetical protein
MSDLVALAMEQASADFGGSDGVFNGTCFSQALTRLAGVKAAIDGRIVRAILWGRADVVPLRGGSHYRIIPTLEGGER